MYQTERHANKLDLDLFITISNPTSPVASSERALFRGQLAVNRSHGELLLILLAVPPGGILREHLDELLVEECAQYNVPDVHSVQKRRKGPHSSSPATA